MMKPLQGYSAPSLVPPERSESYDEARARWARSLTETQVRELASEYLRGHRDECNSDAYAEYERRFGEGKAPWGLGQTLKANKSNQGNSSYR